MRIAYFGLPLAALELLRQGFDLTTCVLSPVAAPGARRLGKTRDLRLLEARALGDGLDAAVSTALEANPPDLIASWFWTRRLRASWLTRARLGGIGVHPSLLPRHRGPNPYFWAIDAGDLETGVSVHVLEDAYDTGGVFFAERVPVGQRNAWQLARALDGPSLRALCRVLGDLRAGRRLSATPQDEALATLAPEPTGADLSVDFCWPTERVLRRIRALSPVPGLALELEQLRFFVTAGRPRTDFATALEPGEAQFLDDRLILRTGDGAISVEGAAIACDDEAEAVSPSELAARLRERLESRPSA